MKDEASNQINDSKSGADVGQYGAWLGNYVTPGVVNVNIDDKQQPLAVNGVFVRFEPIHGSSDKYMVLSPHDGQEEKVRLVFAPHPEMGVKLTTELSIIYPTQGVTSVQEALRVAKQINEVDEETLNFLFRPGVWVTAIFYRQDRTTLVKDDSGYYFARAVTISQYKK